MTAEPTDGLIAEACTGDADALAVLFRRYADEVFQVALRLTRSTHDAEDVTQNVFIGLPEALNGYDGDSALRTWLRTIATRTALLFLRQDRRHAKWERRAGEELPKADDPDPVEARLTLQWALDRMPEELRIVYILREMEGYSHADIADVLGITPGASSVRLYRARQFLRDRLEGRI